MGQRNYLAKATGPVSRQTLIDGVSRCSQIYPGALMKKIKAQIRRLSSVGHGLLRSFQYCLHLGLLEHVGAYIKKKHSKAGSAYCDSALLDSSFVDDNLIDSPFRVFLTQVCI